MYIDNRFLTHPPPTVSIADVRVDHVPVPAQLLVGAAHAQNPDAPALDPAGPRLQHGAGRHDLLCLRSAAAPDLDARLHWPGVRRVHHSGRAERHVRAVGARTVPMGEAGVHQTLPQHRRHFGVHHRHGLPGARLHQVSVPDFGVGRGDFGHAGDVRPDDILLAVWRRQVAGATGAGRVPESVLPRGAGER